MKINVEENGFIMFPVCMAVVLSLLVAYMLITSSADKKNIEALIANGVPVYYNGEEVDASKMDISHYNYSYDEIRNIVTLAPKSPAAHIFPIVVP